MANASVRVGMMPCTECKEHNIAMMILEALRWKVGHHGPLDLLGFDRKTQEIVVNEAQLLRLIQLANPAQQPRRIRLRRSEDADE